MQYLLLIYHSEAEGAKMSPADQSAMYGEYFKFTQEIRDSGNYLGGNPLKPTNTTTTVRVRNAKRVVTDGPFAETKEQLGERAVGDHSLCVADAHCGRRVGWL